MRTGLTLTGVAAADLLAAGLFAAAPVYADSGTNTAYVTGGEGHQYIVSVVATGGVIGRSGHTL
jgi:hypothetical protein